jgi:hypothetical protein
MRSRFEVRDRRWRMEGVRGSEMLTRCISLGLQPLVEERGFVVLCLCTREECQ